MSGVADEFFNTLGCNAMLYCKLPDLLLVGLDKADDVARKLFPGIPIAPRSNFLGSFLGGGGFCSSPHSSYGFLRVALCPSIDS